MFSANTLFKDGKFESLMKNTRKDLKKAINTTKNLLGNDGCKPITILKNNYLNECVLEPMNLQYFKIDILNKI